MVDKEHAGSSGTMSWEELGLDEWAEPGEPEQKEYLQEAAGKYNLNILQVAKIHLAVWKGTYRPIKYAEPRALSKVLEVAEEVGNDEAIKGVIEDFTAVKFDTGVTLEQALQDLPEMMEKLDREATRMTVDVLREVFPDSIIVDQEKMKKRIDEELKE